MIVDELRLSQGAVTTAYGAPRRHLSDVCWRYHDVSGTLSRRATLTWRAVERPHSHGTYTLIAGGRSAADDHMLVATDQPPPWLSPALDKINGILSLGADWDTYGAEPIRPGVILPTLRTLFRLMGPDVPLPGIVPTSEGGVQLEWHSPQGDVEVEIRPSGATELWGRIGAQEHELTLNTRHAFDTAEHLLHAVVSS